jgi:hypothetical protein
MGESIPKMTNLIKWIKNFIGVTNAKNSKYLVINQVKEDKFKWTFLIVALCLINYGRALDVVLNMLESINWIIILFFIYLSTFWVEKLEESTCRAILALVQIWKFGSKKLSEIFQSHFEASNDTFLVQTLLWRNILYSTH